MASVDLINTATFEKLKDEVDLERATTKIYAYGADSPLKLQGCFQAMIESKTKYAVTNFHVVDGPGGNLLSAKTAQDLGLIQLVNTVTGMPSTENLNETKSEIKEPAQSNSKHPKSSDALIQGILNKYCNVFQGEGKLKDQSVKLHINENIVPVVQPQRRIPYHIRKAVSKDLKKRGGQDIIGKVVDQPTPWVSPIVCIPKKDGGTRICVDMQEANRAIQRERHILPTLNDFP